MRVFNTVLEPSGIRTQVTGMDVQTPRERRIIRAEMPEGKWNDVVAEDAMADDTAFARKQGELRWDGW